MRTTTSRRPLILTGLAISMASPAIAQVGPQFDRLSPAATGEMAPGSGRAGFMIPHLASAGGCPADIDGSGAVDFADLLSVLGAWGSCGGCPQDLDGSGDVGFADLLDLLASWGPCPCLDISGAAGALIPLAGIPISLDAISPVDVATPANVGALRDSVLGAWVYPSAALVPGAGFDISGVAPIAAMGLSDAELAEHRWVLESSPLALMPGDEVYALAWTIADVDGEVFSFDTLAYADASGCVKFMPFLFSVPLLGPSPLLGSDYIAVTQPGTNHHVEFKVEWAIGEATGWGDLIVHCEGNQVANAQAVTGSNASMLSESTCTKEAVQIFDIDGGQCACVIFHFGFANGLKSIEIEADGFSIGVSGSFGYSGTKEVQVCKCCPEGD